MSDGPPIESCDEQANAGVKPLDLKRGRRKGPAHRAAMDIDRLPPHSLEAEQGVLGCIFLMPHECIAESIEKLKVIDAMYDLKHQEILEILWEMYDRKEAIDVITVQQRLKDVQKLESVGGISYLAALPDKVPSAANLSFYLNIVREKAILRKVIRGCTDIVGQVYEHEGEVDDLLDNVERKMLALSGDRIEVNQLHKPKDLVHKAINRIEFLHQNAGKLIGLSYGFPDMDAMTQGMKGGEMIVIAARPSMGKAQPMTSKVLTPTGFVNMGELVVGSPVIAANGRRHLVTGVFPQGRKQVNRVVLSDGTFTRCCDEHLWFTQTRRERRTGSAGSVKNTNSIRETLRRPDGANRNHSVPLVRPVEFSAGPKLPLAPWLLGALIGDGTLANGSILFSKPEADILNKFVSLLPDGDCGVMADEMTIRIKRAQRDNQQSETRKAIGQMGLTVHSEAKFLPTKYLHSSILDRLELLRGLLDTDGFVNGPSVEFTTSSEQLMRDVTYLVRSLGGICRVASRIPHYEHRGEKREGLRNYRTHIWFHDPSIVPVTSEKHLQKIRLDTRHVHRSIVDIVTDGEEECQCIAIDSAEHLYVTDDFIVTHNTSIALNIAEAVAVDQKIPVGVFSLEMSAESLMMRMICSRARVSLIDIGKGILNERDFQRITNAAGKIAASPLYIDDSSGISIMELRAKARRMFALYGIKLFVIDYLQLLHSNSGRAQNRQQEIAEISSGIKALAKELDVPIIVAAQLNREMDRDKRHKPKMSDLRESGAIEQDADLIGLLYKPKGGDKDDEDEGATANEIIIPVNLLVAKQRNGPTGEVKLTFLKNITRFESAAHAGADNPPEEKTLL